MLLAPPALVQPPALLQVSGRPPQAPAKGARVSLDEAAARVLDAFDLGVPLEPELPVAPKDRAAYRWLRACADAPEGRPPANPFPAGSSGHKEAEALRALLALPKAQALRRLPTLSMKEYGTPLALWRWGKALSRHRAFTQAERWAFEDRLLAAPGPALTQGYALRHALCFALAEKDEARLTDLRARVPEGQNDLYKGFQAAFGLLGLPMPSLRLWTLPGRQAQEVQLGQDGAAIWMCPVEGPDLPPLPPGTTWVVPATQGDQNAVDPQLQGPAAAEAQALGLRFTEKGRKAYFAASRAAFEKLGLVHFPLRIGFDAKGNVVEIQMGDAAPRGAE